MVKLPQTKVRSFTKEGVFPDLALALIGHLTKKSNSLGLQNMSFSLGMFPKSVNHMYTHSRFSTRLQPWVHEFRAEVKTSIERTGVEWKPKGVTSAVVLFRSPVWVTAESKIRKMDVDNKIKPIFDAIEQATGQPDENYWDYHPFKVPAKRQSLTVYLFDLGDVVEYFY